MHPYVADAADAEPLSLDEPLLLPDDDDEDEALAEALPPYETEIDDISG